MELPQTISMKNTLIKGLVVSVCIVSMTSSAFAVWWNPFTWFKSKTKITQNETVEIITPKIVATSTVVQTSPVGVQQVEKLSDVVTTDTQMATSSVVATSTKSKQEFSTKKTTKQLPCELGKDCVYFEECTPHLFKGSRDYSDAQLEIKGMEGDQCKILYQFSNPNYQVNGDCLVDVDQNGNISDAVGLSMEKNFYLVLRNSLPEDRVDYLSAMGIPDIKYLKRDDFCKVTVEKNESTNFSTTSNAIVERRVNEFTYSTIDSLFERGTRVIEQQLAAQKVDVLRSSLFDISVPKGVTVPKMPDNIVNDETLAGVDENSNGVRDDVERYLAKRAKSKEEFEFMVKYTKEEQKQITSPTPKNRDEALKIYIKKICLIDLTENKFKFYGLGDASSFYVNTPERYKAMRVFNTSVGYFSSSEITKDSCK